MRFLEFLHNTQCGIEAVTDTLLADFRAFELESVLENPRGRGSRRTAKQTVNEKLWAVYQLLEWMQGENLLPGDTIGVGTPFRVRVREAMGAGRGRGARGASRYPLLFRSVGAGSRHSIRLHVTREMFDQAIWELGSNPNPYLAARDALMLDIAGTVGLRRASIVSLDIQQFVREEVEATSQATVLVQPSVQKFDYDDEFRFPVDLALRILSFIENEREELLTARGAAGRARANSAIFLSHRDCARITERAFSKIVRDVFHDIGCEKGVSVHAGRRLFAVEAVESELDERLRLGLDTSVRSICAAVAQKLGHKNPDSVHAYVVAELSRRAAEARSHRASRD
ncbi:MAG: hypothetical protein V4684_04390 [Pseudomonadota bacterium]